MRASRGGVPRVVAVLAVLATAGSLGTAAVAAPDRQDSPAGRFVVPGAERLEVSTLDDLTTAGTVGSGHTNQESWAGLHATGTRNPRGIPGVQLDGYFPDESTTNQENGWRHDSQFVIRLPKRWNGGLVVTGSPGNRTQYALDHTIADWVLAQGFAFAATDKGNTGSEFHTDGTRPGDAIAEWNHRLTQLTKATKRTVALHYGHAPWRTYATGISNGGYLTRWQLENHPELYDGGVDWEGTLWRAGGPNPLTFLPKGLRAYPRYAATADPAARKAMHRAGFVRGSEFLWDYHDRVYWGLTQRIYREELDPRYTGDEADYRYATRPAAVRAAVRRIGLTGRIGKPLITLHGTLDALLPIGTGSDTYAAMVRENGNSGRFRYFRVAGGNHTDGLYDEFGDRLRPILPCYRGAFTALRQWAEEGVEPPRSTTVPRARRGDPVNRCAL